VTIERFEDIEAWQLARELIREIYAATRANGFSHDYGLKDQITRASGSIMHNTAEGFDAGSDAEFIRFLRYAQRSATEVKSELYVALDQAYITQDEFARLYGKTTTVYNKIGAFIKYLNK
jgi:four helix bundle protein